MMRAFTTAIVAALFTSAVFGQTSVNRSESPAAGIRFEVASIKPVLNWPPPSGVPGERGAPGVGCPTSMKVEPSRVDFKCTTLVMLIGYAFRISPERVTGPAWMTANLPARFNIEANIPPSASINQVPEMFQALLADRFKLVVHRGTANLPVFALVAAKGGLRISKAAPQEGSGTPPVDPDARPSFEGFYGTAQSRTVSTDADSEAVTIISSPRMGVVRQTGEQDQVQRWEAPNISLGGLADLLDKVAPLSLPVIDMTGLRGRYQLALEVSLKDVPAARRTAGFGGEPVGASNTIEELEETVLSAFNNGLRKLGLRLERRKGPIETVVVDHAEKTPAEN